MDLGTSEAEFSLRGKSTLGIFKGQGKRAHTQAWKSIAFHSVNIPLKGRKNNFPKNMSPWKQSFSPHQGHHDPVCVCQVSDHSHAESNFCLRSTGTSLSLLQNAWWKSDYLPSAMKIQNAENTCYFIKPFYRALYVTKNQWYCYLGIFEIIFSSDIYFPVFIINLKKNIS